VEAPDATCAPGCRPPLAVRGTPGVDIGRNCNGLKLIGTSRIPAAKTIESAFYLDAPVGAMTPWPCLQGYCGRPGRALNSQYALPLLLMHQDGSVPSCHVQPGSSTTSAT
jgi:hypothetical protein